MTIRRSPVQLEFQANRKVGGKGKGGGLRAAVRRISPANTGDDMTQTVALIGVDGHPGSLDGNRNRTAATP